jgi:hypothetical protein
MESPGSEIHYKYHKLYLLENWTTKKVLLANIFLIVVSNIGIIKFSNTTKKPRTEVS